MRLVQFLDPADGQHLGVIDRDVVIDVTQGDLRPRSVFELYYDMGGDGTSLTAAATAAADAAARARRIPLVELLAGRGLELLSRSAGRPETPTRSRSGWRE